MVIFYLYQALKNIYSTDFSENRDINRTLYIYSTYQFSEKSLEWISANRHFQFWPTGFRRDFYINRKRKIKNPSKTQNGSTDFYEKPQKIIRTPFMDIICRFREKYLPYRKKLSRKKNQSAKKIGRKKIWSLAQNLVTFFRPNVFAD